MGLNTSYRYDQAGRKIEEKWGDLKTARFAWDDFGNIRVTEQEGQVEIREYDALGRLISKTLQDTQGTLFAKESCAYDVFGNFSQKVLWHSKEQAAVYRFVYDPAGNLLEQTDPLDQRTEIGINHRHTNRFGQRVQCSDPTRSSRESCQRDR